MSILPQYTKRSAEFCAVGGGSECVRYKAGKAVNVGNLLETVEAIEFVHRRRVLRRFCGHRCGRRPTLSVVIEGFRLHGNHRNNGWLFYKSDQNYR